MEPIKPKTKHNGKRANDEEAAQEIKTNLNKQASRTEKSSSEY